MPPPPQAARFRSQLTFIYGFTDTDPWPLLMQQLNIPRDGKGSYIVLCGSTPDPGGRDWTQAWVSAASPQFAIHQIVPQPPGDPTALSEAAMLDAARGFLSSWPAPSAAAEAEAEAPPEDLEEVVDGLPPQPPLRREGETGAEGVVQAACEDPTGVCSGSTAAPATGPPHGRPPARDEVKELLQKRVKALETQLAAARAETRARTRALVEAFRAAAPEVAVGPVLDGALGPDEAARVLAELETRH